MAEVRTMARLRHPHTHANYIMALCKVTDGILLWMNHLGGVHCVSLTKASAGFFGCATLRAALWYSSGHKKTRTVLAHRAGSLGLH